ncbi:MAG: Mur ligase family protein [Patescibacteria group bacterium]
MPDKFFISLKRFIPKPVFDFFQPLYHWLLAFFAAIIYGFPSRSLKIIGITGTSGKTTTIEFLHEIFQAAGFKTASLSGLRFKILDREEPNLLKMTMPGRFCVQKFLYEAKKAGCEYVFLEVTSEGIKQSRHKFIKFYAALLTNLSEEHLEAHGGFENYRRAKAQLFYTAPIHVLNSDDPNFSYFAEIPSREKIVFKASDWPPHLSFKLAGEFNKMNAIAALAFAKHEGIAYDVSKKALEKIEVLPGRMEFIDPPAGGVKNFRVLVDYAFLPQTLRKVYETLKPSPLICVLGAAGGGRDKWKRPITGDVAHEFCKKVFVTNEDPYDEDPLKIMNEVCGAHNFEKILDRREAIRAALKAAQSGDIVVITGKGAEPWIMGPGGTKIPWDDRKIVLKELAKA